MSHQRNVKQYRLLFFFAGLICGVVVMCLILLFNPNELRFSKGSELTSVIPIATNKKNISPKQEGNISPQKAIASSNKKNREDDSVYTTYPESGFHSQYYDMEAVAADRLLFTRNMDFPIAGTEALDSLPERSSHQGTQQSLRVEFWQSPLNAVGYQCFPNRLVLFGFYDTTKVKILPRGKEYQLIYEQDTYSLSPSRQYEPLYLK